MGKQWKQWLTLFCVVPESPQMVVTAMKLEDAYSLEGKLWPTNSILKSRDTTLPIKAHLVKAMVLPVVMYRSESWTIKKAEHRRIDAFERWCWRRLLRVPWTARRSNQSILKEISPGYSFGRTDAEVETSILWLPDAKSWLIWKDPDARKDWRQEEEGDSRGWDGWMASPTQCTYVWIDSGSWWWSGRPGILWFMGSQWVDTAEPLNRTEKTTHIYKKKNCHTYCIFGSE